MEADRYTGNAASEPSLKLRSYQQEMLEASIDRNVIVAMDTGSGKTHVAIARILIELERERVDQLVWFCAPSVALCEQQANVLANNLLAYQVRTLTGRDGVDKWTDQRLWDAFLENVHVVVSTPAVLADALTHGFVTLSRLSLCVFDEAHRATKGHPMNSIMQRFYHPARIQQLTVPRVLGLTASPVVNAKCGSLDLIEQNLAAVTTTPKRTRRDLEAIVNLPTFHTIPFTLEPDHDIDPLRAALGRAVLNYDFSADPYVLELQEHDDNASRKSLGKVFLKQKTYCSDQLRALALRASSLELTLGSQAVRWYLETCIAAFKETMQASGLGTVLPELSELERKHLESILDAIQHQSIDRKRENDQRQGTGLTSKVQSLIEVLARSAGSTSRGIVFVEQRVHTAALKYVLERIPEISKSFRISAFVGTSQSSSRKSKLADLVAVKTQDRDLQDFYSGRKNLMIATDVLEEGIDVSACNFVVCFEPPKNLVSFVQRRGRARQKHSQFFLFAPEDDLKLKKKDWAELEAEMKQAYMEENREIANLSEDDDSERATYRVEATAALLTLENAKSHLYHFCSVALSKGGRYVDSRPEFDPVQDPTSKLWTASVDLPSFVHLDVRRAVTSMPWRREASAIKDAAFQAYVALHKAGLVNDHLLPLIKDYGPDIGQTHLNQPSIVQVSQRVSSWFVLSKQSDPSRICWSPHLVTLTLGGKAVLEMTAYFPAKVSFVEKLHLFWNEFSSYDVTLENCGPSCLLGLAELTTLTQSTRLLLSSVFGSKISEDPSDFPFLLAPKNTDLKLWLQGVRGSQPAVLALGENAAQRGLVRINGQAGRSYFLQGVEALQTEEEAPSTDGLSSRNLVIRSFPKRRDFLHPIPTTHVRNEAYTAEQRVPLADCTIDRLPADYALFAAFVPSILHRVDTAVLVQGLQLSTLEAVGIGNAELVFEAICAPAACESVDYNRLEYLGDSILKHCTELQVMSRNLRWPEGYLTSERDRMVRNSNLARAALEAGLDGYILDRPFTGSKWRPPHISQMVGPGEAKPRVISSKTLADAVEALIGAAFVDGGLTKALKCIATLLPTETWDTPDRCFNLLTSSLRVPRYRNSFALQRLIGHDFEHPSLLVEAVTHSSFPYNTDGMSYERLEFLGDSVLDMVVTPRLFAHGRKLKHWELHRIHEALVNSHFLGFCCMKYAVEEEKNDIEATSGAGKYEVKQSLQLRHLHNFLRAGHLLTPLRQKAIGAFEEGKDIIEDKLLHGKEYPWVELVTLGLPKFFCDMVESVLGALFIDSKGDLSICREFADKLGILRHMEHILDEHVECISPKERLGAVADRDAVTYVNFVAEDDEQGQKFYGCAVQIGDEEVVKIGGCRSKDEAEVKAAHRACQILEENRGVRDGRKKRKFEAAWKIADDGDELGERDEDDGDMDGDDDGGGLTGSAVQSAAAPV